MTKVFHVISGLKVGGAEMMLHRLILCSSDGKYSHTVLSLDPFGEMRSRFIDAGIELIIFNFKKAPISSFFRLISVVIKAKPDIVQTWMYHADLLGGLAARIAGNKHVIWGIRTTDISNSSHSTNLVRWVCAKFSSWLPSVIVCAAEASMHSHIDAGYDARKMVVVPNGYDFSWLQASTRERTAMREQVGINSNEIVVGCLGRFHADKDQENFVRAAGLLAPSFPKLRFLMVGRNLTWDNSLLVDWINQTGFRNRFVLLGERKDVPQCLVAMDIFCLHSRTEGFPNVLAEAMATGLPCVTTDVGDAAMLLSDAGVVVPKEDSAALAKGIEALIDFGQDTRSILGLKAKKRIEAAFSMDRARERFESIYQQILTIKVS